ncbi:MAG TPA: phage tail protein [Candidatus Angelobacter sp.]|nr:phage tail protein [Candidatus Angelobacter sp.]
MALMGGKGGGKNALAAKPNLLSALRVQTSSYGQVIPILYGQNRIAARLIWAGDFQAIPHTSTTKVGGKGLGSGGGNAISNTTYTYQTAVAMALCQGPILNIHNVWDTKGKLTLITATVPFTVPGGGGGITVTPPGTGVFHSHRGVGRADAFSFSQFDFGSDGSVPFSGTQQTPMTQVVSSPGAGQFTQSGAVFTFSAADAGKVMTITYVYSVPDSNSNGQPQQKLSLTLFLGSRPQTPWSYLTSAHPGQDLGYNGIAYVAASAMDLGESGTLPNLSFEVLSGITFGAGIADAEPSVIIADLLANQFYGLAGAVAPGDLTQYRNFCTANGLFLSPVLDAQKDASAWIQEILDVTNAAAVWSEGVLKIIPYGDTTQVGNGATFIPNTAPIYDLTTSDLLTPVVIKRPSVADVMNSVSVEFANRSNDYNPDVAEDKDDAMIALYGLRKASPVQAHSITTTTVAKFAANLLRKRSVEIRATYTFSLGWQFNLLEPMDLVTLTIPELGYNKKPVRITAMREDDSGKLEVDAEDFPWGTAAPTLYPHQAGSGFITQANSDPGAVSTPIIFEANDRLSLTGNYEVWLGVCGPTVAITGVTYPTPPPLPPSPIQITANNHGYKTGQKIIITGVGGITAANGTWTVTVIDPNTFTLNGSIGSGTYTSGGVAVNLDWGGCHVWISPDNQNYVQVGAMYGPSRMGVLTAQLVSSADPDTAHTLAIDLTQSTGILNSGTQSDCDNFRTLCYVDGELISYEDATLTGSFKYDLGAHGTAQTITGATNASPIQITVANHGLGTGETVVVASVGGNTAANGTWVITVTGANTFTLNGSTGNGAYTSGGTATVAARLRRGVFGSPVGTHNAGSVFLRLDNGVFVWEADPTLVGTTIYFKFTSFNRMGLMEQSLANATAYSFAFNGIFGNNDETPANNATLDSVFVSGTSVNIRAYGPGGVGTAYSAWKMKDQGGVRSIPAQTITTVDDTGASPQVTTNYWISYDFSVARHRAWVNYNNYVQAVYRGQMRVGLMTTVNSSGTGGTTGGLGDSGSGGSGSGNRKLPQM